MKHEVLKAMEAVRFGLGANRFPDSRVSRSEVISNRKVVVMSHECFAHRLTYYVSCGQSPYMDKHDLSKFHLARGNSFPLDGCLG